MPRCLCYRESRTCTVTAERLGPTLGVCLRDVSVMRGLAVEPSNFHHHLSNILKAT